MTSALAIAPDLAALAAAAATRFAAAAARAIGERGQFAVALTGGRVAKPVLERVAEETVDWRRTHLFWIDERAVPPDHADSNFRAAREALIERVSVPADNVHRMLGEMIDLDAAARLYDQELERVCQGRLDLVLLGMGPDGHVCSLFPGHPALDDHTRRVLAVVDAPKPPPRRLTLGFAALGLARELCFVIAGGDKAPAVREALTEPASRLPAARVARGAAPVTWLLDSQAAAELPEGFAR